MSSLSSTQTTGGTLAPMTVEDLINAGAEALGQIGRAHV
jgi:hypothetical protein